MALASCHSFFWKQQAGAAKIQWGMGMFGPFTVWLMMVAKKALNG